MTTTTMTRPDRRADAHSPGATFPGIPFSRLLRVEWSKATDTRAARWLLVSILTLTSEWNQRTVLTTFTQEPRRTRIINAKVTVSLLLAGGAAVFGALVTAAGLGVAAASGRELDANLNAGVLVGFVLFMLLNVLTGVAFGALLHNSAAAIVLYFALPTAFAFLGIALKSVADWLDTSTTFNWLLRGEWSGHTPQILVSVTIWVAIPLAAGLVRTVRREIN